jgi:hypothetical protein
LSDLALISTNDLIQELFNRYPDAVVALERASKTSDEVGCYKLRWQGNAFKCAGLAAAVIEDINYYRRQTEVDDDE